MITTLFAACSDEGSADPGSDSPATTEVEAPSPAEVTSAVGTAVGTATEPTVEATLPTTSEAPTPVADDATLAAAALLTAGDVGDGWEMMSPELNFPNGADLARTVPACAEFADVVFEGGARHGTGVSGALGSGENLVFTYVVVFPTVEEASEMFAAVDSTAFDECWARFNEVAVAELPFGIESGTYASQEPPQLSISAHDATVKYLDGSLVIAGDSIPDTCVCAFAQVGRGIVEFHSPAPVFDPARRSEVVQAAIDRLRITLDAPPLDLASVLDAAASTKADLGDGHQFIVDPVAKGAYDAGFRQRQDSIEACSSIERPMPHGATYRESIDGRGWLYVNTESPQLPYVTHSIMILADDTAAQNVMSDLRGAADFPTCISQWSSDVHTDDADNRNPAWSTASVEFSAVGAEFGEPIGQLGDDQITVTWQQQLSVDGVEAPPETMSYFVARFGAVIFTFTGNNPDRTAATAGTLADRIRDALL